MVSFEAFWREQAADSPRAGRVPGQIVLQASHRVAQVISSRPDAAQGAIDITSCSSRLHLSAKLSTLTKCVQLLTKLTIVVWFLTVESPNDGRARTQAAKAAKALSDGRRHWKCSECCASCRGPKRQKLTATGDATGNAPSAAPPAVTSSAELGCYLTRLRNAPDAHNLHAKGLNDLLEGDFTRCLLTNYMFDLPWLFAECPRLRDVPVLLVHGERDRQGMTKECREYANVTSVAPPLPIPYGTHHTKMLVALYPEKVRVAIFTANFLSNDWNTKTQGIWYQDFGLKVLADSEDEEKEAVAGASEFEADLAHYLSSLGAPVKVFCGELKRFDFSTARVALVPAVPGVHKGKDMEKYGHLRVRKLLKMYKVPPTDNPLICQFSSLGSLDEKWLFGEFAESFLPGKRNISSTSMPTQALHIIWPSVEDVQNSLEGWSSGRSIPCPLKNMKPFLHKYLRKWTPPKEVHRQNAMPHIKSYARFSPNDDAAGELDWAIVTSSNLSKAAWGSLQKNNTQFMIRSYELGVIFLPQLLGRHNNEDPRLVTIGKQDSMVKAGSQLSTMKATTCVRVVLPTDELVRMECTTTMTVGDLVGVLEKRSGFQKAIGMETNGNHLFCDCIELKYGSLLIGQVEEFDILEYQFDNSGSVEWITKINDRQSRGRIAPIMRRSPHKIVETVRPVTPDGLIPLWQVKQDRIAHEEEAATRQLCGGTAQPQTEVFEFHPQMRLKELIQHSNVRRSLLRRRGARRHPTWQNKQRGLLFSGFKERRHYAKLRKYAQCILLQAGMQMIDRIQILRKNVRELVFLLRDAVLGGHTLKADDLLSLAWTMVNALARTTESSDAFPGSEDTRENMVRRLSWDIAGKDGGAAILLEGWVITGEWGTFWRSQRREYACLCDNHILYFFSSRTRCANFVFEIGRERDGTASEASKRFRKDNCPLGQIDLLETDWTLRKSIYDEESGTQHRNAFAFFDPNGRMRLVLDVSTATDATMWVRMLSAEISQNKLFARMRELNGWTPAACEFGRSELSSDKSNPLTTWMEILTQSSTTLGDQNSLVIPLRTLYSQIDRLNGEARAERYKSWTLSQTLKDLQRDRVKINGLILAGASLETNILALALEALRTMGVERSNIRTRSYSGAYISSMSIAAKEMIALRFARQVIICSSRTHGGGDIFDTLHLLFGNDRFCICPDALSMEPIEITISEGTSADEPLSAHITMKMVYRVIPTDSIGPTLYGEQTQTQRPEFKIQGTYSQRLNCDFFEGNNIEGTVQLQFAG
ncbi:Tyrosyl-DNA phosphodiesterase [Phytophthora megakarya]|uniref:Tyrosyl-DNA phosphodiesterase n=1 Tax=Phytophthora megakarya TaxID=4795 RepID=A0A225WPR3_9STRA|nr:Tyrosyl-DNA phosphodiesterase [Phytophthora megakarya]